MAQDLRVIMVKLADRLHNMRTLKHLREDKTTANRPRNDGDLCTIGASFRDQPYQVGAKEDISLRYLNPQQYIRIVHLMQTKREEREAYVSETVEQIRLATEELDIFAEIYGRPKHTLLHLPQMKDQKKQFNEIYDLLAIRVIV